MVATAETWLDDLPGLGIGAVIDGEMHESTDPLEWINMPATMASLDSLRLATKIVSIYALPKRIQAWMQSRKRHHGTSQREAVGWLEPSFQGAPVYRSLSHMDVLVQSEQLSSMDAIREGEAVWAEEGFASVPGTILGLWHPLLQGAAIIAERERLADGQIFIGGASLARDIAALQPPIVEEDEPAPGARALYCFDSTTHLIPPATAHALEHTWKLTVCPALAEAESGRILSLSLPDSPPPTRTADHQAGNRLGTLGRLIPGYKIEKLPDGLTLTSPDDVSISLPNTKLDGEDFLSFA